MFKPTKNTFAKGLHVFTRNMNGRTLSRENFDTEAEALDRCRSMFEEADANSELRVEGNHEAFTVFERFED